METKKCSTCGEVKPINEFYKQRDSKDGLHSRCKCCKNKKQKEYCKKHFKKIKEYNKKWKKEHRKELNKYKKHVVALLKDSYIKAKLIQLGWEKENITEEIIEEKRNIIKTKRLINKINKSIN